MSAFSLVSTESVTVLLRKADIQAAPRSDFIERVLRGLSEHSACILVNIALHGS
jgi:hypothetical protein